MAPTEKVTYCRVCEPLCGMIATVDDGELVKVRPDPDHPLSAGFACPKGIAMAEVQNDPDRVLFPQRRRPDGSFERVTWDEALDDIGSRLKAIVDRDGGEAVGWYMGNPGAFSYSHPLWVKGFLDALGSPHSYTASSQDVSNRFAASWFLYGSPFIVPIPDLERTDFLLVVGANPLVSHGSVLSAPRIKDQLHAITDRGGRVVVVDPRRSETARAFEHVAIDPDGDAWLLLSMLEVIFAEGLEDRSALERQTRGSRALRALVADFPPEATEARSGVSAREVRRLAQDLAAAKRAAVYGRTGSCLGRSGTLVSFLLDALNAVTGNLDREGGAMFGDPPVDFSKIADLVGLGTYSKVRSRVGDLPEGPRLAMNDEAALLKAMRAVETTGLPLNYPSVQPEPLRGAERGGLRRRQAPELVHVRRGLHDRRDLAHSGEHAPEPAAPHRRATQPGAHPFGRLAAPDPRRQRPPASGSRHPSIPSTTTSPATTCCASRAAPAPAASSPRTRSAWTRSGGPSTTATSTASTRTTRRTPSRSSRSWRPMPGTRPWARPSTTGSTRSR